MVKHGETFGKYEGSKSNKVGHMTTIDHLQMQIEATES